MLNGWNRSLALVFIVNFRAFKTILTKDRLASFVQVWEVAKATIGSS